MLFYISRVTLQQDDKMSYLKVTFGGGCGIFIVYKNNIDIDVAKRIRIGWQMGVGIKIKGSHNIL